MFVSVLHLQSYRISAYKNPLLDLAIVLHVMKAKLASMQISCMLQYLLVFPSCMPTLSGIVLISALACIYAFMCMWPLACMWPPT